MEAWEFRWETRFDGSRMGASWEAGLFVGRRVIAVVGAEWVAVGSMDHCDGSRVRLMGVDWGTVGSSGSRMGGSWEHGLLRWEL